MDLDMPPAGLNRLGLGAPQILKAAETYGWTVERGKKYFRMRCSCEGRSGFTSPLPIPTTSEIS